MNKLLFFFFFSLLNIQLNAIYKSMSRKKNLKASDTQDSQFEHSKNKTNHLMLYIFLVV